MINKWYAHEWVVLSFPKQDKTILWNDINKTYDFYKGGPWRKEKLKKTVTKKSKECGKSRDWEKVAFLLGGALVAAVIVVITLISMIT